MEEAVDAAEVDERAVLGDVLDDALDDLALLEVWQGLRSLHLALLLEEHAAGEHDVAALLVELDDLELVGLADELVEVADRRRSTCEPGRNAFTPMSTERPPFTWR